MAMCRARVRALLSLSRCYPLRTFSSSTISSEFQNVGFIGLGNMGFRMANNLINAGYKLAVHDINKGVMKKFSDMGIPAKDTPVDVAESSDVVITMLPSSSHVVDVYTGPNGLLRGRSTVRPRLFIDSSTIDPQTSRKVAATVSECYLHEDKGDDRKNPVMLDAPVSGGVIAAEAGLLTFMVGGSHEAYLAAKPIFDSMGKNAIYCGGAGTGSSAKLCNNLAMGVSMLGVSEALALGQSLGGFSTLQPLDAGAGVMEGVPSSRNYAGGFASKLMAKDLNLAAASAKAVDMNCPLTSQAREIYDRLCKDGHESEDFSCVFRHYYSGQDELSL